ncbi:MAG: hypothetical protein ABIA75_07070 [Candidatus Neomarinimicrobiota bacterium]
MKRYSVVQLLLVWSLLLPLAAQSNRIFWDGGDWKRADTRAGNNPELAYQIKAAYLNGVLDGRLFYYLKAWAAQAEFADSLFAETVDYLSTRELVRAIDNFYADPLQVYVPVPSAVIIATMYAEQLPLTIIDEYIRQSKFWINDLMLKINDQEWQEVLDAKVTKSLNRKE